MVPFGPIRRRFSSLYCILILASSKLLVQESLRVTDDTAMGLKCPECAAEDRGDSDEDESSRSENKAGGVFKAHPPGGMPLGLPRRRDASVYRPCQIHPRRRFLMEAENHTVAVHGLLGKTPKTKIPGVAAPISTGIGSSVTIAQRL